MKNNKLKLITLMLLVILIIMVGFFGVYSMSKGQVINTTKDYSYLSNIKGTRVTNLELSTSTKEVIKDKDGNVVKSATEDEITANGYTKEDVLVNKEEDKNQDNFNAAKQVIQSRLEKMGVKDYIVRVNEENGKIVLELPEDDYTDNIITILTTVGKFEIVDAETDEVLISKDDISASNVYKNTTQYGTELSFSLEFNDEGAKKFEEITRTYTPAKEENKTEEATTTEGSEGNTTEGNTATTTEAVAETTTEATASTTEENKEKKVTLKMDDSELMSTSFEEPVTTGKMYLTVGQAATTSEDARSNYNQAQKMSILISTKTMPLTYKEDSSTFVQGTKNGIATNIILIVSAIIIGITIIELIIRFKVKGLLAGIGFAGFTALLLLTLRYWNVDLSIEGITGIFIVMALNVIFVNKMLSNLQKETDNKKETPKRLINMAIKDSTMKIIPLFIIAIVFSFAGWESTLSFGMVMFWGLALIELYNILITKNILLSKQK